MANDNDKKNPILNRQPNSLESLGSQTPSSGLEGIGSKDYASSYRRDIQLAEQRARLQTVEMQRVMQQINDLNRQYQQNMQMVARVRTGFAQPSEDIFRSLGLTAEQARATMRSIPVQNLSEAVVRTSSAYEKGYQQQLSELTERQIGLQQQRRTGAERLLEQHGISRASRSGEGMRAIMEEPAVQAMAREYAARGTISTLSKGVQRAANKREYAGIELAQAAGDLSKEGAEQYVSAGQNLERAIRKEAALKMALGHREEARGHAEDIASRSGSLRERIFAERQSADVRRGVASGEYGTMKKATEELRTREEAFLKALEALEKGLNSTGEASQELTTNLEEASKSYKEQRDIVKAMDEGGGGGAGRMMRTANRWAPVMQGVMQTASYAAVGADEQQMALRIRAAQITNQKYTDAMAATQGDMAALRRVTQRQYETDAAYGAAYGMRANVAQSMDIGAATGLAGLQVGTAVIGGGSAAGGMITASQAAMKSVELGKGITGASAALQMSGLSGALKDTVNQVPDAARQAFFDYRMGAFRNLMGAGQRFSGLYDETTSSEMLNQMAAFGISPEQSAQLAGFGTRNIGERFIRHSGDAARIMKGAGAVQAAGYMSAEQYMANVGQMAELGGGQKDVEEILANAVARGVDDAKSLEGLFNMAESLSRDAASRGINAVGANVAALGVGMDIYKGVPIEESLKQNLVRSQLQQNIGRMTNTAVDPANMIFMSQMSRQLPGATKLGLGRLAAVSPLELSGLQETYFKNFAAGQEVPETIRSALGGARTAFVDEKGRYRGAKAVEAAKLGLIYKGAADYLPGLSQKEQQVLNQAITSGDMSLLQGYPQLTEKLPPGFVPSAIAAYGTRTAPQKSIQPLTGEAAAAQQIGVIGAQALTGQVTQGGAGGLSPIVGAMLNTLNERLDVTKAGAESAAAAKEMKLDVSDFDASVNKFDVAIEKLINVITPMEGASSYSVDWDDPNLFKRAGSGPWNEQGFRAMNRKQRG